MFWKNNEHLPYQTRRFPRGYSGLLTCDFFNHLIIQDQPPIVIRTCRNTEKKLIQVQQPHTSFRWNVSHVRRQKPPYFPYTTFHRRLQSLQRIVTFTPVLWSRDLFIIIHLFVVFSRVNRLRETIAKPQWEHCATVIKAATQSTQLFHTKIDSDRSENATELIL